MWQYAIQQTGHDFEPTIAWSTSEQTAVAQLKTTDGVDLLSWNPTTDESEIYVQLSLDELVTQIDHTPYAKLLEKMTQVMAVAKQPMPPTLQRQWYLVGYLASLKHQALINTAAALLGLTVLTLKTPPMKLAQAMSQQLRGVTDQARCWLMAAQVTDLQLIVTSKPLKTLLQHLLTQADELDFCCVSGQSYGWQLANDANWLSQVEQSNFRLAKLESPVAYRLIRAAYLERVLG